MPLRRSPRKHSASNVSVPTRKAVNKLEKIPAISETGRRAACASSLPTSLETAPQESQAEELEEEAGVHVKTEEQDSPSLATEPDIAASLGESYHPFLIFDNYTEPTRCVSSKYWFQLRRADGVVVFVDELGLWSDGWVPGDDGEDYLEEEKRRGVEIFAEMWRVKKAG